MGFPELMPVYVKAGFAAARALAWSHCARRRMWMSFKLGQPADVRTPAKVVDDKAPDTGGLGGIDHGCLQRDAGRAHDADGSILPRQCLGEILDRVRCPDDWNPRRECRRGLDASDDGYVKAVVLESGCDGSPKVARRRWGC